MKKVLSTVAALGLVAGMATTASALDFSVSGVYEVEGYYKSKAAGGVVPYSGSLNNVQVGEIDSAYKDLGSDAYLLHSFKTNTVMKVNDAISMFADIRFADDNVWGGQDAGDVDGHNETSADILADHVSETNSGRILDVSKLYMEYMSPIGKWRIGRTPANAWYSKFVDSANRGNRIMYWPNFIPEPWGMLFFTQKFTEKDAGNMTTDSDSDYYEVDLTYKTDSANVALAYGYMNNESGSESVSQERDRFKGYGKFTSGNYFLETEFDILRGDQANSDTAGVDTIDYDSHAFIIHGGGTFGNLAAGIMYFTITGEDDDDADMQQYSGNWGGTGTGNDFEPVLIMTGKHSGVLNGDQFGTNPDVAIAGVHAIGAYASYQSSPKLNITGVLAIGRADETNTWDDQVLERNTTFTLVDPTDPDSSIASVTNAGDRASGYGWEIDVTASYKLLDNLTYAVSFAYLDTGDFFDTEPMTRDNGDSVFVNTDADNIYLVKHALTMKF